MLLRYLATPKITNSKWPFFPPFSLYLSRLCLAIARNKRFVGMIVISVGVIGRSHPV